jgi:hypothetical protein
MIEEEGPRQPDYHHDGDGYLYDFFKYMTSISLLSLGALFTFLQMETISGVPPLAIASSVVLLGLAALLSFNGAEQLVAAKAVGKPLGRTVHVCRKLAPPTYLVGIVFLAYICGDILR